MIMSTRPRALETEQSLPLPTRRLGTTDMQITRVGFGAWAIGGPDWAAAWGPQDDNQSIAAIQRSEEHTSELQSPCNLVCRLLLEKKKDYTVIPVEVIDR